MSESQAIIVVGMHRSGTSALSGCLSELGVFMGNSLYGPQQGVNEKGFYENAALVEFNDDVFDQLLWSWDYPLAECFTSEGLIFSEEVIQKAVSLVSSEYGSKELWGMKDPRTSLLLPLWQKALSRLSIKPHFIIMLRNPIEVAGSLRKRDDFSFDKSLMLWLNYTLSSVYQSMDSSYVIVSFDELLDDQNAVTKKLNDELQLGLDEVLQQTQGEFIDKKLRNHKGKSDHTGVLADLSSQLYELLLCKPLDREKLSQISNAYSQYLKQLSPVLSEHILSVKKEEVHFRTEFYDAYRSTWWKISRPLKKVEEFLRDKKSSQD